MKMFFGGGVFFQAPQLVGSRRQSPSPRGHGMAKSAAALSGFLPNLVSLLNGMHEKKCFKPPKHSML